MSRCRVINTNVLPTRSTHFEWLKISTPVSVHPISTMVFVMHVIASAGFKGLRKRGWKIFWEICGCRGIIIG